MNCRTTLRAGFTTVRNLGLFVKTGGYLLDVALVACHRQRVDRRPAPRAGRARDHADRRPPRPDDVPAVQPRHHAAQRRRRHRERRARGAQGGALPDQVRRAAHQDLGVRRRDVAQRARGRAAVLRRRARGDRRRSAPRRPQGRRARARRRRHPRVHPRRRRLHRARFARERRDDRPDGRARHVPRPDELPVGRARRLARRAGAPGEGGRGVPEGAGDAQQGDRGAA